MSSYGNEQHVTETHLKCNYVFSSSHQMADVPDRCARAVWKSPPQSPAQPWMRQTQTVAQELMPYTLPWSWWFRFVWRAMCRCCGSVWRARHSGPRGICRRWRQTWPAQGRCTVRAYPSPFLAWHLSVAQKNIRLSIGRQRTKPMETLPCVSIFECIDTNALIAGYVIDPNDASIPAAHIILRNNPIEWKMLAIRVLQVAHWHWSKRTIDTVPCLTAESIPQHLHHFEEQSDDDCSLSTKHTHQEAQY